MADKIIEEINKFSTFSFDEKNNRVINLKSKEDTNIDEFLEIGHILDCNNIRMSYRSNFEIQIIK